MQTSYPLRQQWLGNIRGDLLSGIVVALALIPEAIAFSLIPGVDSEACQAWGGGDGGGLECGQPDVDRTGGRGRRRALTLPRSRLRRRARILKPVRHLKPSLS